MVMVHPLVVMSQVYMQRLFNCMMLQKYKYNFITTTTTTTTYEHTHTHTHTP